jgi:hypothetical protein
VSAIAKQGAEIRSERQNLLPLWRGPSGPVTTRARGRSSGSASRQSRASREPAFVRGVRCNSSRPHGRGRDQDPRVEDDRWHTNASRRVLRHRGDGRCQLVVATVAHVAKAVEMSVLWLDEPEPRVPKRVGLVQGLEQRRVDLPRAVCSDSRLLTKTLVTRLLTEHTACCGARAVRCGCHVNPIRQRAAHRSRRSSG